MSHERQADLWPLSSPTPPALQLSARKERETLRWMASFLLKIATARVSPTVHPFSVAFLRWRLEWNINQNSVAVTCQLCTTETRYLSSEPAGSGSTFKNISDRGCCPQSHSHPCQHVQPCMHYSFPKQCGNMYGKIASFQPNGFGYHGINRS